MHARPRSSLTARVAAIALAAFAGAPIEAKSAEQRALDRLFAHGGPGWNSYPIPRSTHTGAAALKRAARKRRNIRARAAK